MPDSRVQLRVSWLDPAVRAVAMSLRVRIPAWAAPAPVLTVNGVTHGTGKPGSFYEVARTWRPGDTVELKLQAEPELLLYTGMDEIKGSEGKRHALKIGPIVFPAVGALDKDDAIAIPQLASASPASWLVSVPGERLHFSVKGLPPSVARHVATDVPRLPHVFVLIERRGLISYQDYHVLRPSS